jgi:hypothetical protein
MVDDRGQVVWFRPLLNSSGRVMDFKTQTYRGKPVLTWEETPGEYVIFDDTYHEIARFTAANGYRGTTTRFSSAPRTRR